LTTRTIPNWATYPALFGAILINSFSAWSSDLTHDWLGGVGLGDCLVAALLCFVLLFVPYLLKRAGAGDVKLATALGALLGTSNALLAVACSFLAAGVAVLAWLLWLAGPFALAKALARQAGTS